MPRRLGERIEIKSNTRQVLLEVQMAIGAKSPDEAIRFMCAIVQAIDPKVMVGWDIKVPEFLELPKMRQRALLRAALSRPLRDNESSQHDSNEETAP